MSVLCFSGWDLESVEEKKRNLIYSYIFISFKNKVTTEQSGICIYSFPTIDFIFIKLEWRWSV